LQNSLIITKVDCFTWLLLANHIEYLTRISLSLPLVSKQSMKKSPLLIIFLIVFLDLVGFGIVIPILPYYSKDFGANAFILGWLMASYSIAQFLFAPFWGALSDRFGRRPILLTTILGGAISLTVTAFAPSLFLLFLGRSLAGIFGANISTASAYIADVTSPENRAKGMGIIGAGFGLGFIFGPAIGGILSSHGYQVPILVAAILNLFNFIFAFFVLNEPAANSEARKENRRKISLSLAREALAAPSTAIPILLFFLSTLAFTQLEVSFALFVLEKFGFKAQKAGILLAGMGVVMVLIQGGLIGKLAKKFGEKNLLIFGFSCMAIAMCGAGLSPTALSFALFLLFISLGNGLVNPSLSSLMSKGSPDNLRGSFMGIYQSAGSLARIIGPPISGFLFDNAGIASPIFISSILMFFTSIISFRNKNHG